MSLPWWTTRSITAAGRHDRKERRAVFDHYGQWDNAAKYIDPRTDAEAHQVASTFPVNE